MSFLVGALGTYFIPSKVNEFRLSKMSLTGSHKLVATPGNGVDGLTYHSGHGMFIGVFQLPELWPI